MSDFYNSTRGPLAATLSDGTSVAFPPKQWLYVDDAQESSASIVQLCAKGFLKRAAVPRTAKAPVVEEPVATKPEVASDKTEVVLAAADHEAAAVVLVDPEPEMTPKIGTSAVKEEFSKKKR